MSKRQNFYSGIIIINNSNIHIDDKHIAAANFKYALIYLSEIFLTGDYGFPCHVPEIRADSLFMENEISSTLNSCLVPPQLHSPSFSTPNDITKAHKLSTLLYSILHFTSFPLWPKIQVSALFSTVPNYFYSVLKVFRK
jgi:hypothetical protein